MGGTSARKPNPGTSGALLAAPSLATPLPQGRPNARSVHRILLARATNLSESLASAIREVGPVTFRKRDGKGLAYFLSRTVVGQQLSVGVARNIWNRIVATAGSHSLGVPQCAEEFGVAFRSCGISASKLKSLRNISLAEKEGRLLDDVLSSLSVTERTRRLMEIWGIGPWTCDMALIFYYRLQDVWPEGDIAVQRTFSRLIGRRDPTKTALRFSPYRSYLALTMWRVVDDSLRFRLGDRSS